MDQAVSLSKLQLLAKLGITTPKGVQTIEPTDLIVPGRHRHSLSRQMSERTGHDLTMTTGGVMLVLEQR